MKKDTKKAIIVEGVNKEFKLPHEKNTTVKSLFTGLFKPKEISSTFEIQHALKEISFEVKEGEFFGIVGRNGSGKSTLLKMLAGIYQPTKGKIFVSGKLVPFIELGVGFNPELTGRENVYLNGALLGFSVKEIDDFYHEIVEFAELDRFMDQKLKNYSSGMQVRLAFSLAIRANADILLVDEVLAVGDADFQRKCFDYFKSLKRNKKTVIFVSHDMSAIREYCDRAILIEKSRMVLMGSANKVANAYTKMFIDEAEAKNVDKANELRWGDDRLHISNLKLSKSQLKDSDPFQTISFKVTANHAVEKPVIGFSITAPAGIRVLGTNSQIKKESLGNLKKGESLEVEWTFHNVFAEGTHYVNLAATYDNGASTGDWWDEAARFKVYRKEKTPYIISPEIRLKINMEGLA